jgi:hypothetical protein
MRHPGSFKPESIAKRQSEIQIVDTHESLETRVNIGFAANCLQMNRTLLTRANPSINRTCPGKPGHAGYLKR